MRVTSWPGKPCAGEMLTRTGALADDGRDGTVVGALVGLLALGVGLVGAIVLVAELVGALELGAELVAREVGVGAVGRLVLDVADMTVGCAVGRALLPGRATATMSTTAATMSTMAAPTTALTNRLFVEAVMFLPFLLRVLR
ncbi:MAG: hypothetical protein ACP5VR_00690 [Acidimicrobiales bacterium]